MLDDIKKTLWAAADKLRANMDAAEYKHLVLGQKDGKKRFADTALAMSKAFSLAARWMKPRQCAKKSPSCNRSR